MGTASLLDGSPVKSADFGFAASFRMLEKLWQFPLNLLNRIKELPMKKRFSRVVVSAAAAVVLMTAAGCSQATQEAPEETTTTTEATTEASPTETATETATEEPTEEATETVAAEGDAATQEKALKQLVDEEMEQLKAYDDQLKEVYSDISADYELPGTVTFTYTFKQAQDAATFGASMEEQSDSLKQAAETVTWPRLEQLGHVGERKITYSYLNPDGSSVWEKTYTQD